MRNAIASEESPSPVVVADRLPVRQSDGLVLWRACRVLLSRPARGPSAVTGGTPVFLRAEFQINGSAKSRRRYAASLRLTNHSKPIRRRYRNRNARVFQTESKSAAGVSRKTALTSSLRSPRDYLREDRRRLAGVSALGLGELGVVYLDGSVMSRQSPRRLSKFGSVRT